MNTDPREPRRSQVARVDPPRCARPSCDRRGQRRIKGALPGPLGGFSVDYERRARAFHADTTGHGRGSFDPRGDVSRSRAGREDGHRPARRSDRAAARDRQPTSGVELGSRRHGVDQTAYRVRVGTSAGAQDVWDSGKVASAGSVGVPYGGPALEGATRYYWTVQVWDGSDHASEPSAPAWFETGLLPRRLGRRAMGRPERRRRPLVDRLHPGRGLHAEVRRRELPLPRGGRLELLHVADQHGNRARQGHAAPHANVRGQFSNIAEIDLAPVVTPANAGQPHHIRIKAEGPRSPPGSTGRSRHAHEHRAHRQGHDRLPPLEHQRRGRARGLRQPRRARARRHGAVLRRRHELARSRVPADAGRQRAARARRRRDAALARGDAPVLRHEFTLDKPVASARAYVYGLGLAELRLNGAKVGDRALTRPPASSRRTASTTPTTSPGGCARARTPSACGSATATTSTTTSTRSATSAPRRRSCCCGSPSPTARSATSRPRRGWKWSTDAITANDLYDGESYDARLHRPWDQPGFDDAQWTPVEATTAPRGKLVASLTPPVRAV